MIRSRSKHFMKHVRRKWTSSLQYQNIFCCGFIAGFLLATRRRPPIFCDIVARKATSCVLTSVNDQPRELITGLRSVTRMLSSYMAAILSEDPCIRATLFHPIVFISFIAQSISVAEQDPIWSTSISRMAARVQNSCPA